LRNLSLLLLSVLLSLYSLNGFSQTSRKVTGKVSDTSGVAVVDASVMLIDQKDTLRTKTDADGQFSFSKVKNENFNLRISIIGYYDFRNDYSFGKKKNLHVGDIKLKMTSNALKEVVIKAKPNPIRVMQDTVEYNAAAYQVLDGDNVADLIKQFSGIEVDDDYNVKSMGQNVVKLRVNGKDFFTNDVKEFIATLPAGIVSKIQIIDDYGDQANFTGLKIGEPQKLINIVTKPGMDRGQFGSLAINAGSNDQIGSKNRMNLWKGDKQTGLGLNYTTQNNGAGDSQNANISINHREKLGKTGSISFNYNANQNNNAFIREQAVETLSDLGTYFNNSQNTGNSKNGRHGFSTDFNHRNKTWFLNGSLNASLGSNSNNNFSLNNQSGVTKQDFRNVSDNDGNSSNIDANFNLSKKLKNIRNHLSTNFGFAINNQKSAQLVNTNTLYYNQQDQTLLKDSVLNRNIDNDNRSQNFSFSTAYSAAISKVTDTINRSHINLNYSFSLNNSFNRSATNVLSNLTNEYRFVDSLSSELKSLFITQSVGVSYSQSNKKTRLTIGFNARPNILHNNYINLGQKVNNNTFNYSPTINYNNVLKKGKTLTLGYSGSNNSPTPAQLQPIRNTQNLQNIIIGNPDLKPSFQHRLNANYNYIEEKSGASMFASANFSTTQNEIVNNMILLADTLGAFRQETRYENTNGTYNLSGNYNISIPIKRKVFTLGYNGTVGVSNRALYINNVRYFNSGLNFSQQISGNLYFKKGSISAKAGYNQVNNNSIQNLQSNYISLGNYDVGSLSPAYALPSFNPGQFTTTQFFVTRTFNSSLNGRATIKNFNITGNADYSYSSNSNSNLQGGNRDLQNLSFSLNGNAFIKKTYRISFNGSKRISTGFAVANQNPLLLGVSFSRYFLKNKALSLTASASDLLNQGNMVFRQVSGNSVIDSKNNVITRVFSFGLSYNVSKFGARGTTYRVDPDF
jgi:hypothetical protein